MWLRSVLFTAKLREHSSHWKGFSPVWVLNKYRIHLFDLIKIRKGERLKNKKKESKKKEASGERERESEGRN